MSQHSSEESLDHGSDPNFFDFYAKRSESARTLQRFSIIQEKILLLMATDYPVRASGLRVLDVGCNAGTQCRMWARLGHQVTGLDINAPLLNLARQRAEADGLVIQFDVGSATALPYADESFDVCLLPELLEHVIDWQACLNEAIRVLRPGGYLYLSTTNALCPKQQEFELPLYSWYPSWLKRHYERLSVTTRPELVNHARYPAVHWFTYRSLSKYLSARGLRCMDRFDLIGMQGKSLSVRFAVRTVRAIAPLRFLGHVMTAGTSLVGIKAR